MTTETMTWRDASGQANKLYEDVKAILTNPEAADEDKAKVGDMIKDADALKAKAMQLQGIETGASEMAALQAQAAADQTGDPQPGDSKFNQWGEFLFKVWQAGKDPGPHDKRLEYFKDEAPSGVKDLAEATGAAGGFLVPTEFRAELLAIQGEVGIVRSRATVIPMRRRQITLPVLDQTSTTAGQPHWFGGMTFEWIEEGQEKPTDDPAFREINLTAHKLVGFTRASDELLDDSAIPLEAFLAGPLGFAGGAVWMEDYAFLRGTGTGTPLGVALPAGATITVARAAANAVSYVDLVNMLVEFLPSGRGVWVISQSVMPQILQLQDPNGNYVWQPSAREGMPQTIFGFPVIWTEKLPLLGTQGDVLLADFRYYLIGDRQATTVESTKFEKWREDKTSWRMVHRVDGQPWLSAPLTYQDGTTQVSPFVILGDVSGS